MCRLIKIKVDDFNVKSFIRDILNYYRKELNHKDILWWIEGLKENDILNFNHNGCLEEQFFNYIKKDGNKLYVPFLEYKNVKQAIHLNGEVINIYSISNEEDNEEAVGIEIENINGAYIIKTLSKEGFENISYIKDRYKIA
ncbi:MAG: hypothetical protein ACRC28_06050 [Clostridium sp.]|uniref:hypothetical protein n=1 Tax=Clostridium sp. TaxID=1506 RepID=UPI003F313C94